MSISSCYSQTLLQMRQSLTNYSQDFLALQPQFSLIKCCRYNHVNQLHYVKMKII